MKKSLIWCYYKIFFLILRVSQCITVSLGYEPKFFQWMCIMELEDRLTDAENDKRALWVNDKWMTPVSSSIILHNVKYFNAASVWQYNPHAVRYWMLGGLCNNICSRVGGQEIIPFKWNYCQMERNVADMVR